MASILIGLILLLGQTVGIVDIREGEAMPPPFSSPGELLEAKSLSNTENPNSNSPGEFNSIYVDKTFFLSAIKQNPSEQGINNVTGITVPHHLLVKNLTAEIFDAVSGNDYKTIIIISPDHFNGGKTKFSTTPKDFKTVFGSLETDKKTVQTILSEPLISNSTLFSREHGIHSVTPFIKYHFPDAKIVPITIRINSNKEELDTLAKTLTEVINSDASIDKNSTLILQSTDFSHYLTEEEANKKDQQTTAVLLANIPDQILTLNQPDNIDSTGSQYIQSKLQKELFESTLQIIHTENSNQYTEEKVAETTSYITQIYSKR